MPTFIEKPTVVLAAGNKPKRIEEYAGRVSSRQENVSVARMVSPGGWEEPAQQPEFDEISVVLRGTLRVETDDGMMDVRAGQAVIAHAGERVRYSTPEEGGAEYVAVCLPAFSPDTVHRLEDGVSKPIACGADNGTAVLTCNLRNPGLPLGARVHSPRRRQ